MSDPAASAARLRDDAGAYTAGARRRGGPEVGAAGSEAQMPRTPSAARPDSQRSSAEPPLIRVVAEERAEQLIKLAPTGKSICYNGAYDYSTRVNVIHMYISIYLSLYIYVYIYIYIY